MAAAPSTGSGQAFRGDAPASLKPEPQARHVELSPAASSVVFSDEVRAHSASEVSASTGPEPSAGGGRRSPLSPAAVSDASTSPWREKATSRPSKLDCAARPHRARLPPLPARAPVSVKLFPSSAARSHGGRLRAAEPMGAAAKARAEPGRAEAVVIVAVGGPAEPARDVGQRRLPARDAVERVLRYRGPEARQPRRRHRVGVDHGPHHHPVDDDRAFRIAQHHLEGLRVLVDQVVDGEDGNGLPEYPRREAERARTELDVVRTSPSPTRVFQRTRTSCGVDADSSTRNAKISPSCTS